MIRNSIERGFAAKREEGSIINDGKNFEEPSISRPWPALKDPRIVRVSRSFGGKDRHSKVRTIRGLRDRRIRLSVPTAIQLYDLQERLGLNQPSKAVDWLISAAQQAIDKLPPLQIPAENTIPFPQSAVIHHDEVDEETQLPAPVNSFFYSNAELLKSDGFASSLNLPSAARGEHKCRSDVFVTDQTISSHKPMLRSSNEHLRSKLKDFDDAQKWFQSFAPHPSNPFHGGSMNNVVPYSSSGQLGLPPNLLASNSRGVHGSSSQAEDNHSYISMALASSMALPSGAQLLFYPPGAVPSVSASANDFVPKQFPGFQVFGSSAQNELLPPDSVRKGIDLLSNATPKSPNLHDCNASRGFNPSSFS